MRADINNVRTTVGFHIAPVGVLIPRVFQSTAMPRMLAPASTSATASRMIFASALRTVILSATGLPEVTGDLAARVTVRS